MQTDFLPYIYQAIRGPENRFPAPDRRADGLVHGLVRPHLHLDGCPSSTIKIRQTSHPRSINLLFSGERDRAG